MIPAEKIERSFDSVRKFTAILLILGSCQASADANDGNYLGYRLGDTFVMPKGADLRYHISGAHIVDLDPGKHPHHVDTISIYVSPKSSVIGSIFGEWYFANDRAAKQFADRYLEKLVGKYDDWKQSGRSLTYDNFQLWVDIENKPPVVGYWPSSKEVRVGIGLIYAPESRYRSEWMAMVDQEAGNTERPADQ